MSHFHACTHRFTASETVVYATIPLRADVRVGVTGIARAQSPGEHAQNGSGTSSGCASDSLLLPISQPDLIQMSHGF